jgi:hypothetical protein
MLDSFKEFSKMQRLEKATILITQKLHGTNASVWITAINPVMVVPENFKPFVTTDGEFVVRPAKRTSFIDLENDNFGFAKFVAKNKDALARCLGPGTWFGEWVGPGINSGEGLKEKQFALFNTMALDDKILNMRAAGLWPENVDTVPVLFFGVTSNIGIEAAAAMEKLKTEGSQYAPGFMRPEGIVIQVLGTSATFKQVFESEETQWKKPSEVRPLTQTNLPKVDHLLQPIRLEKLLSRDEEFLKGLPKTLPQINSAYVADLLAEGQLSADEDERDLQKKALGKVLFGFVKSELKAKGVL